MNPATTKDKRFGRPGFSLVPLPLYSDVPRPLKSLEIAFDPMAPGFSATTGPLTKEAFTQALTSELKNQGIVDTSGGILASLLEKCAKDGTYIAPSADIIEGVRIGWYSKPVPPSTSEMFEHSQMDFQAEVLRIMRESEERMKRMISLTTNMRKTELETDLLPGETQLANIEKSDMQVMLWVVCYVFSFAHVSEVIKSKKWEAAISYLVSKKWLTWGRAVHNNYGVERKVIDDIAEKVRSRITKAAPFQNGDIILPEAVTIKYATIQDFSSALTANMENLKKNYGKNKTDKGKEKASTT